MSFKYLDLKRLRNDTMQLGLTPAARENFDPAVLCLWLQTTQKHYRNCCFPAVLSTEAERFVVDNEKASQKLLKDLGPAGGLLMEAILHACEMPTTHGFDESLEMIAVMVNHSIKISALPIPKHAIKFSVRKHRDSPYDRLMTVRTDVLAELGFEGACLALSVLRAAVARDLKVRISIVNYHDLMGENAGLSRLAPAFDDFSTYRAYRFLIDYLCKDIDLERARKSIGIIKLLHEYFEKLQTPETVYPRNLIRKAQSA